MAGPFGLYGGGRDFTSDFVPELDNGLLLTKVPAVLDGHRAVTLRVPVVSRDRVGLDYGDHATATRIEDTPSEVRFDPCARTRRTGWPGGLILRNRRPVTLLVEIDGRPGVRTLRVGRIPR